RAGHEREGCVTGMQVGEMADLVDEHRAAVAACVLIRPEHEVVEEQLSATLEDFEQRGLAVRTVEDVALVDSDHRQRATLGRERVSCPGGFLLLRKECGTCGLPLLRGDDRGKPHPRVPMSWSVIMAFFPASLPLRRAAAQELSLSDREQAPLPDAFELLHAPVLE